MPEHKLTEKDIARLEKDFTYQSPKEGDVERYEEIRKAAQEYAATILYYCPDSRERSLAMTKIDESVSHANNSIARNG